jgi:5-formyltetrahydrofolate cyclo-ligase
MAIDIQTAKQQLRRQIREKIKTIPAANKQAYSRQAEGLLAGQSRWQQARSILFHAPIPGELDLWPLVSAALSSGRTVALPRFVAEDNLYVICEIENTDGDLQPGQFGIREPAEDCRQISLNRLDLILVPGVAFDLQGRRLGRGKGYYDQLLAEVRGPICGVAFDEQIVTEVPLEPHDVVVDCILTPTRWLEL